MEPPVVAVRLTDGTLYTTPGTLSQLRWLPEHHPGQKGDIYVGRSKEGFTTVVNQVRNCSTALNPDVHLEDQLIFLSDLPLRLMQVNVGGTVFWLRYETAFKIPYLVSLGRFTEAASLDDVSGELIDLTQTFIDRDPSAFSELLLHLEDPSLLGRCFSEQVSNEARYFQVHEPNASTVRDGGLCFLCWNEASLTLAPCGKQKHSICAECDEDVPGWCQICQQAAPTPTPKALPSVSVPCHPLPSATGLLSLVAYGRMEESLLYLPDATDVTSGATTLALAERCLRMTGEYEELIAGRTGDSHFLEIRNSAGKTIDELFLMFSVPGTECIEGDDWPASYVREIRVTTDFWQDTLETITGSVLCLELWKQKRRAVCEWCPEEQAWKLLIPLPLFLVDKGFRDFFGQGLSVSVRVIVNAPSVSKVKFIAKSMHTLGLALPVNSQIAHNRPPLRDFGESVVRHYNRGNQITTNVTSTGLHEPVIIPLDFSGPTEEMLFSISGCTNECGEGLHSAQFAMNEHLSSLLPGVLLRRVIPHRHYGLPDEEAPKRVCKYIWMFGDGSTGPHLCNGTFNFSRVERVSLRLYLRKGDYEVTVAVRAFNHLGNSHGRLGFRYVY